MESLTLYIAAVTLVIATVLGLVLWHIKTRPPTTHPMSAPGKHALKSNPSGNCVVMDGERLVNFRDSETHTGSFPVIKLDDAQPVK